VAVLLRRQHSAASPRPAAVNGITTTLATPPFSYGAARPSTDASGLRHLWFDVGARLEYDVDLYRLLSAGLFAHVSAPFDIYRSCI
jgi:hypothetical protein